jgi:hypothetical protein
MKKYLLFILITACIASSCSKEGVSSDSAGGNSTGGSMARFTLVGNYLYTVNQQNLKTFDVSNPAAPTLQSTVDVGPDIETIFPFKGNLYIGSSTAVYLYSLANPAKPERSSSATYIIRSRDPVVANDSLAYSAIRSINAGGSLLNVIDIRNPKAISIRMQLPFTEALYGLGIADSALYLCRHSSGLQVFSISDSLAYRPISRKVVNDSETYYDVIPSGNRLYTWIEGGNCIFDITARMNPVLLSKTKN